MLLVKQKNIVKQEARYSGRELKMIPPIQNDSHNAQVQGKLSNKVALITAGETGLTRAVALAFAKEGANIALVYLNQSEDANNIQQLVEKYGRSCLVMYGNLADEKFCQQVVQQTLKKFGKLDILVNNAVEQNRQNASENMSTEELEDNLQANMCPMFYMTQAALPYLKEGSTIINTTSVTPQGGNEQLSNSSSTKRAIMTFTRSLSNSLEDKGIRVNGVAPGPVWSLVVPSNLPANEVEDFAAQMESNRAALLEEIAPSFVLLASDDTHYMAGQIIFMQGI
jgi:NAD(P)-dependent dehydrogenase (short-subunit alcohol dehydrogenase family)